MIKKTIILLLILSMISLTGIDSPMFNGKLKELSVAYAGRIHLFYNTYICPITDALVDIGEGSGMNREYKDLYLDGLAYIDGFGEDTDLGDFDIHSIDGLYGVDDLIYIDMGTDGYLDFGADTGYRFLTSPVTLSSDLRVDGGDIGITADTDLLQLAADSLTVNGDLGIASGFGITGTNIRSDNKKTPLLDLQGITKVSSFDGGIGVEWTLAQGTAVDDTTNFKRGYRSIKSTSVNQATTNIDKTGTWDFSNKIPFLRFYVDTSANVGEIRLYFATTAWSDYFEVNASSYFKIVDGWNTITLNKSLFSQTGSPDWASLTQVRCRVLSAAATTVNLSWDDLIGIPETLNKGIVIFTFDDQFESTYTKAKKVLDQYNYKGVVFVVQDYVGEIWGGIQRMTLVQLTDLYALGWDISAHSKTHPDLTGLSASELTTELKSPFIYLHENGFHRSARFMSYPGGAVNSTVITEVKKYYDLARCSWSALETHPAGSDYLMRTKAIINTTTTATVQGWIDAASNNKEVLVLMFHDLVDASPTTYQWLETQFDTIVDYVNASADVDVLTFSDLMDDRIDIVRHYQDQYIDGNLTLTGNLAVNGNDATSTGQLNFKVSGDTDDYLYLITTSNISSLLPIDDSTHTIGLTTKVFAEGWFDSILSDGNITLNPTGNNVILDNSHLQIQGTYDLLFKGAGTIAHENTGNHYLETMNNSATTGWWWETGAYGGLAYKIDGVIKLGIFHSGYSLWYENMYLNDGKSLYLRSADEAEYGQLQMGDQDFTISTGGTNDRHIIISPASDLQINADTYISGSISQLGGSTGVSLSGANGIATLTGLGDGADESLIVDMNTVANYINFSSGTGATAFNYDGDLVVGCRAGTGNRVIPAHGTDDAIWAFSDDTTQVNDYIKIWHNQTNPKIDWGQGTLCLDSGNISILGLLSVSSATYPVLNITRNVAGERLRAAMKLERTIPSSGGSNGEGVAFYFTTEDSAGNTDFAGLLGGALKIATSGSEVGQLIFAPSWHNDDPYNQSPMTLTATSVSTADLALAGNLDITGITTLGDGGTTNYLNVNATGDVTFVGSAGFYSVRINQSAQPTPDTGEMVIWRDTDDAKVYLMYNDTSSGVKKIELL